MHNIINIIYLITFINVSRSYIIIMSAFSSSFVCIFEQTHSTLLSPGDRCGVYLVYQWAKNYLRVARYSSLLLPVTDILHPEEGKEAGKREKRTRTHRSHINLSSSLPLSLSPSLPLSLPSSLSLSLSPSLS